MQVGESFMANSSAGCLARSMADKYVGYGLTSVRLHSLLAVDLSCYRGFLCVPSLLLLCLGPRARACGCCCFVARCVDLLRTWLMGYFATILGRRGIVVAPSRHSRCLSSWAIICLPSFVTQEEISIFILSFIIFMP